MLCLMHLVCHVIHRLKKKKSKEKKKTQKKNPKILQKKKKILWSRVWEIANFLRGCSPKDIRVLLRAALFLGKWCGVATYFFMQKKEEKN